MTLQWRYNGRDGVWNQQPHDRLVNRLSRRRSKKTSKLRITGLCAGNSPGTGEFPAQMASNAENVPIWWRHHEKKAASIGRFPLQGSVMQKVYHAMTSSWVDLKTFAYMQAMLSIYLRIIVPRKIEWNTAFIVVLLLVIGDRDVLPVFLTLVIHAMNMTPVVKPRIDEIWQHNLCIGKHMGHRAQPYR